MKLFCRLCRLGVFILIVLSHFATEARGEGFANILPDFSLQDPAGQTHTKKEIVQQGVVILVTAPIFKNKGAQEGWSKYLSDEKKGAKGHLIFLEDLSVSSFKTMALHGMKKDYKIDIEPILLIDETGQLRQQLGVLAEQNVVLVYNSKGQLIYQETGKPSPSSAQEIWKVLGR